MVSLVEVIRKRTRFHGMRSARSTGLVLAAVAACGLAGPAQAQTAQIYSAGVGGLRVGQGLDRFGESSTDTKAVAHSLTGSDWLTSASASDDAGGTVTAGALIASPTTSIPTYIDNLQANAQLTYDFMLVGPTTTSKVPILLAGGGTISANLNHGFASAVLQFGSSADNISLTYSIDSVLQNTGPDDTDHSFSVYERLEVTPGTVMRLATSAFARVSTPGFLNGIVAQSSASVDPTFTILGTFGDSYHFVGLPASAIGIASPVPESSTGIMLVAGGLLVGAFTWRRRTTLTTCLGRA